MTAENIIFVQQVRDATNTTLDVIITGIQNQSNIAANAANTTTVMANGGSVFTANEINFVNTANVSIALTQGVIGGVNVVNVAISSNGGLAGNPGGSNTWLQFNNNSSFGATANLTYNLTTNATNCNGTFNLNGTNLSAQLATISAAANSGAVGANGTITVANVANLNFNNTATINVAVGANGTQTNVAFSINLSAVQTGSGSITDYSAVATANQTVFTLSANAVTGAYVVVTINGLLQIPGTHYSITSNNVLTFTSNCAVNDVVDARIWSSGISSVIGTPGGANTWIQYNDSGTLGGSANLIFNKANNTILLSNGNLIVGTVNVANVAIAAYAQANAAANTVAVSLNSGTVLASHKLNFINSASILPIVSDVGNGNANISFNSQVILMAPLSSLNTSQAITTGTAVNYNRSPKAFTLTGVRGSLQNASTSGVVTVQIRNNGSNVLSTPLTISQGSNTSVGGNNIPAVIAAPNINDNDLLQYDITTAGTSAVGLGITLIGQG